MSGGGHVRLFLLARQLEEAAFTAFARHDRRSFAAAFQNRLRRFEHKFALSLSRAMASEAVAAEDWQYLFLEIDVGIALDFGDVDRGGADGAERADNSEAGHRQLNWRF